MAPPQLGLMVCLLDRSAELPILLVPALSTAVWLQQLVQAWCCRKTQSCCMLAPYLARKYTCIPASIHEEHYCLARQERIIMPAPLQPLRLDCFGQQQPSTCKRPIW